MDGRATMTPLPEAAPPRKILGRTGLKVQIGAACLAVLGLGSWLSPKPAAHALPASEERAVPLLEEQGHARVTTGLARVLDEVVSATRDYAVRFAPAGPPPRDRVADFEASRRPAVSAFGVRISDTRILTHINALPPTATVPGWGADGARFDATVAAFARSGAPQPVSLGIALQGRSGALLESYGPTGVIVDDVVVDGPAHRAGIEPGDLVLEVSGVVVADPATALSAMQTAAASGASVPVRVRPFGARLVRSLELTAAPASVVAVLARGWRPDTAPPDAGSIFPEAALDAAGVAASSRVLSINGTPTGPRDEALRVVQRRRTPLVMVLADQRGRFVAAIEGPR